MKHAKHPDNCIEPEKTPLVKVQKFIMSFTVIAEMVSAPFSFNHQNSTNN